MHESPLLASAARGPACVMIPKQEVCYKLLPAVPAIKAHCPPTTHHKIERIPCRDKAHNGENKAGIIWWHCPLYGGSLNRLTVAAHLTAGASQWRPKDRPANRRVNHPIAVFFRLDFPAGWSEVEAKWACARRLGNVDFRVSLFSFGGIF